MVNNWEKINNEWTLFLDRDGVINYEKENDYIRNKHEFVLYNHVKEAFQIFKKRFQKIIIVTNQRGIGKGYMSHQDLHEIHNYLQELLLENRIDAFYYASDIESNAPNRKPNTGMGLQAKKDFPEIDFNKSIMIGNNISDMKFGKTLGMTTLFLTTTNPTQKENELIDFFYQSLYEFAKELQ